MNNEHISAFEMKFDLWEQHWKTNSLPYMQSDIIQEAADKHASLISDLYDEFVLQTLTLNIICKCFCDGNFQAQI